MWSLGLSSQGLLSSAVALTGLARQSSSIGVRSHASARSESWIAIPL